MPGCSASPAASNTARPRGWTRRPERGAHVPVHGQQGGTAGQQLPLHAGDDPRRLLPVRAGADVRVHVRLRQAQIPEEHIRHPRVVMLARVDDRLVDASLAERADMEREPVAILYRQLIRTLFHTSLTPV